MSINENQLMLLGLLRSELMAFRGMDQIDNPALISALEQIQKVVHRIKCEGEEGRRLCDGLLEKIAITRKWAEGGDFDTALSNAAVALSFFLLKKEELR